MCRSFDLTPLFSLGNQAVSDFVTKDKIHSGIQCPIELEICSQCTLVQQRHTAPQEFLYSRHYWYHSSTTQTMRDALADVARVAERTVNLQPGDVVLDIGSNDGQLLRSYSKPCITVGVEPATNLAERGSQGVDIFINDFWSEKAYLMAMWKDSPEVHPRTSNKAKVITAIGCFYDLPDPNSFIADIAKVLAPAGVFIAQLMCLKQTLDMRDVGNFCHEHLLFFSLLSLERLFNNHGLAIFDIEENDVNGGSYRVYVSHTSGFRSAPYFSAPDRYSRTVEAMIAEKKLADPNAYVQFRSEIESNRRRVHAFISDEVRKGKRVYVLGASTKGNVILQYCGLDNSLIEGASDRSPEKHGLYTIGTGIRICSEEEARAAKPDYFLVLPYSFRNELMEREKVWHDNGGRFIFPIPELEVI